jgi:hypothetical protein
MLRGRQPVSSSTSRAAPPPCKRKEPSSFRLGDDPRLMLLKNLPRPHVRGVWAEYDRQVLFCSRWISAPKA